MYLSLNIVRPTVVDNIQVVVKSREVANSLISSDVNLYKLFNGFMINARYIRYGDGEKVVTKRLADLFNLAMNQNISFNQTFPKLMNQFMEDNSNYGIIKRVMTEGTMYVGIGLSTDPIPAPRVSKNKTEQEIKIINKRKNDVRAARKREISDRIKQQIIQRTQWTDIGYQQLVHLGFIVIVKNGTVYNIEGIIEIARANIITYVYNNIGILAREEKIALATKRDFELATEQDKYLSEQAEIPIYTNRLLRDNSVYDGGNGLWKKINRYNNSVAALPKIDHIVYPNIQQLELLVSWLKSHSRFKIGREMLQEQEMSEYIPPQGISWVVEDHIHEDAEIDTQYT